MNLELWRKIKKEKKLTLIDISKLSGIPKRTVDEIFAGNTLTPRIDTVEAIEKALGITKEQEMQIPAEKQELVDLILQMDEESLKEALTILNYVTNK